MSENTKTPAELMKEKIYKAKVVQAYERAMELEAGITTKLNLLLSEYFDNFSEDQSKNEDRYNRLNKAWKYYCYNINRFKKNLPLRINAFEMEVAGIIEKNPKFKSNQI